MITDIDIETSPVSGSLPFAFGVMKDESCIIADNRQSMVNVLNDKTIQLCALELPQD